MPSRTGTARPSSPTRTHLSTSPRAARGRPRPPAAPPRLPDLRVTGGDALTDAVLRWLAELLGLAVGPVTALLHAGRVTDVVPLGLVLDLLTRPDLTSELSSVAREA